MTSIFRIVVPKRFSLATRPNGIEARRAVLRALESHDTVELDFDGVDPTPSFADECVGVLCREVGWDSFKSHIKFSNITDTSRSLFKHVISKRMAEVAA